MEKELCKQLLYKMALIREFENAVSEYKDTKAIYGSTHCYNGEEAVAVGVCASLNKDDYLISNHRPHGHAIAKGMDPKIIMAELFGKQTGSNMGKGGSMHIHDPKVGLIASSGIVGSGIPIACGAAFSAKYKNEDKIACVFFGDGSANEGILHECFNLASVWNLPVLFVLEDNNLAITTNTRVTSSCNDYVSLASSYGIEGCHVDGQYVATVYTTSLMAVNTIRSSGKPFILQADTIRFSEHAEGAYYRRMIEKKYRNYETLEIQKKERCPIKLFVNYLVDEHILESDQIEELFEDVKREVDSCIKYASESPFPDEKIAMMHVFSEV